MSITKDIENKLINLLNKAKKDGYAAANKAIDEMYIEATQMYKSFIDQYYSYETHWYIRHGTDRPGTKKGFNLYKGSQIQKGEYDNPYLDIEFDASNMEGYERCSPDFVLNSVMQGVRGISWGNWTEWSGQYNGTYFSYNGSPHDAFEEFEERFDEIASGIFKKEITKLGWNY